MLPEVAVFRSASRWRKSVRALRSPTRTIETGEWEGCRWHRRREVTVQANGRTSGPVSDVCPPRFTVVPD